MSNWERVSDLFERALAVPPAERAAFLDRESAGDDELRGEIESLLAAHAPAQAFFSNLEADVVGPSVGRLLEEAETIPAGATLGAYEIEGRIGGGGMGVVYRARDHKLDRTVALKFIGPELTHDPVARDRLIREARAAAALDDPRICAIHAIEETPDGRLFLVMPHYLGETLKQRLARGRMSAAQALDLATELAEGLSRAHRAGIIHRDIKPANVLITGERAVKILDFGLAKLAAGPGPTRTGATPGTAAYMAPEQVRGDPADPRSDVWSLGVVLYEMLSGSRPFQGDTEAAVLYAVLEGTPDPLEDRTPGGGTAVAPAIARLVERMLSKDPALRPADAGVVAAVLRRSSSERSDDDPTTVDPERVSAGRAHEIAAQAPSLDVRHGGLRRQARKHGTTSNRGLSRPNPSPLLPRPSLWRRRRGALAVALAAGIGIGAVVVYQTRSPTVSASQAIAVLPFIVRGDAELDYLRDGMVHLLSTKLDGVGDLRAVDPHALLASLGPGVRAPDPATGRAAATRFGAQAFILGAVFRVGSGIELNASLYGPDGELLTTASSMAEQDGDLSSAIDELAHELVAHRLTGAGPHLAGIAAMTTRSLPALRAYLEGEYLLLTGRPAAARTALQSAVALDSTFGLAWYRLARATGWVGPVELNEEAASRAVHFGGALPERTRALVAAYRVFRTGDPLEAERLYRRILADYPDDKETLVLLGETLFHNNPFFGRPTAEAREPFERALAMDPRSREIMLHLMELAAAEGRLSVLDSLSARYLRTEPQEERPTALHAYAAMRSLVLDGPAGREQALQRLNTAGPQALFDALVRVAPHLRDPDLSDRLAEMLTHPSHAPNLRASGHLHRAWIAVGRGRWSAAEDKWQAAGPLQPDWTLVQRALAATLPYSPLSRERLDSLRATVQAWTPPAALEDGLHEGDLDAVRAYLLGLLSWRAADDAGLVRAIADLSGRDGTEPGAAAPAAGALALVLTLEALEHWRDDRPAEALAALERAELRIPFHRRARSPILEQHLNRYVRAEALRAQGALERGNARQADADALRWYTSLEDGYFHWGAPFVGPALLASAQIHERHGRTAQAVDAYERFLGLWADADPELDAWLELARERLDAISGNR